MENLGYSSLRGSWWFSLFLAQTPLLGAPGADCAPLVRRQAQFERLGEEIGVMGIFSQIGGRVNDPSRANKGVESVEF